MEEFLPHLPPAEEIFTARSEALQDEPTAELAVDAKAQEEIRNVNKTRAGLYRDTINRIFEIVSERSRDGELRFARTEIEIASKKMGYETPPLNLGDLVYYYRYRSEMPKEIASSAKEGNVWIIKSAPRDGETGYVFRQVERVEFNTSGILPIKIPDATPSLIEHHRLVTQEQGLLAKIRYNRLMDTYLRVTALSVQNHLRTTVKDMGQIEVDELYIGVDATGVQYVIPVQAKRGKNNLSPIQSLQDIALCRERFPQFVCRAVAARVKDDKRIELFTVVEQDETAYIVRPTVYELVPSKEISNEELEEYSRRCQSGS